MHENEFYAFMTGLVIGVVAVMLLLAYTLTKVENRFERSCLLEQTVVLNDTPFTCERVQ